MSKSKRVSRRSYLISSLQPGEKIVWIGDTHPAYIAEPLFWTLLVSAGIFVFIEATDAVAFTAWAWSMFLLPAIYLGQHYLIMASSEAALTDRRVLVKTGIFSRSVSEIHLSKVESLATRQSFLGRIFHFGDLEVKGTGSTTITAPAITRVMDFRAAIQNAAAGT